MDGAPVLGALSLAFWAVYLRDQRRWWALIPAGILLTLTVVSAVDTAVGPAGTGATFLLGAAATFALVAVLPGGASRRWWAWIPAGALLVAAIIVLLSATEWLFALNVLWPLVVIGAGAVLIWRAVTRRRTEDRGAEDRGTGDRGAVDRGTEDPGTADRTAAHHEPRAGGTDR